MYMYLIHYVYVFDPLCIGILRLYESILLQMDFMQLAQFLTRLPTDISADELFRSIESIKMTSSKRRFTHVLSANRVTLLEVASSTSLSLDGS